MMSSDRRFVFSGCAFGMTQRRILSIHCAVLVFHRRIHTPECGDLSTQSGTLVEHSVIPVDRCGIPRTQRRFVSK
jgi:hypothetical protein